MSMAMVDGSGIVWEDGGGCAPPPQAADAAALLFLVRFN